MRRHLEGDPHQLREGGGNSEETIQWLMEQVEEQRSTIEALEAEKTGWEERARDLERDFLEAQEDAGRQMARLQELRGQLSEMDRRLADEKLLHPRFNKLAVSPSFLLTGDYYSGADVSHMVVHLNDVIFQCAAMMADDLIDHMVHGNPGDLIEESIQELIAAGLNTGLIQRLYLGALTKDTVLFEALVGNFLTCWCHSIVVSFYPDSGEADRLMKDLWVRLVSSVDHKIAKTWLSITHSQLETEVFDTAPTIHVLKALMVCAGWLEKHPEGKDVTRSIETKVLEIRTKALEIKGVVTQRILSAEVRLFYPPPDSLFDPTTMEDVGYTGSDGAGKTGQQETVFCSTGLGVEYICSGVGQRSSTVILKAKVMLVSTVHAPPYV